MSKNGNEVEGLNMNYKLKRDPIGVTWQSLE